MALLESKQVKKILGGKIGVAGFSANGGSDVVTTVITTALTTANNVGGPVPLVISTDTLTQGIVTGGSVAIIINGTTKIPIDDGSGNEVYGKVTEAAGVYTLTYFSLQSGVETPYNFGVATTIDFDFCYRFSFVNYPSDTATKLKTKNIADDPAGGTAPWGNTIYVDAIHGDDSTGTRESKNKSFQTIHAAVAASVAGDTVIILPGLYQYEGVGGFVDTGSLRWVKKDVRVYAMRGVHIIYDSVAISGSEFFDDDNVAGNYYFQGHAHLEDKRGSTLLPRTTNNIETKMYLAFDVLQADWAFRCRAYREVELIVHIEDICQNRLSMGSIALDNVKVLYKATKMTKSSSVSAIPINITQASPNLTNSYIEIDTGSSNLDNITLAAARRFFNIGAGTKIVVKANDEVSTGIVASITGVDATIHATCLAINARGTVAVSGDISGKIITQGTLTMPTTSGIGTNLNSGSVNWDVDVEVDNTGSAVGVSLFGSTAVDNSRNSLTGRIKHVAGSIIVPPLQTAATNTASMMLLNLRIETVSNNLFNTTNVSLPVLVKGTISNKAPAIVALVPANYIDEAITVIPGLTV